MNVGDTVYADYGRYGYFDVRKGVVVKVTPSGQVSVDFGRKHATTGDPIIGRFTPNGTLIGDASSWGNPRLITEEQASDRMESQRAAVAERALFKATQDFRFTTKAEAIERAKAILALAEALIE